MLQKGRVHNNDGAIMVKDIDPKQGIIEGYFAVFGNVDSDGDVILPGAFVESIEKQGKRIKHLWQHQPDKPIAAPKVREDHYGLVFESKISMTSLGRDVLQLYLDEVIDEHSIGYQVVKSQQKSGYNELQKLTIFEGSSVTWGSNPLALTTGIKSLSESARIAKMHNVEKALDRGRYENEEIFHELELCYKELKSFNKTDSVAYALKLLKDYDEKSIRELESMNLVLVSELEAFQTRSLQGIKDLKADTDQRLIDLRLQTQTIEDAIVRIRTQLSHLNLVPVYGPTNW